MKNLILTIFLLLINISLFSQSFPENDMKKKLNADLIEMDYLHGNGVFIARNKNTKKWGMYQWLNEGTKFNVLIPMEYDKLMFFSINGNYTAVYNDGKVGFYLSKRLYGDDAKQTVACLYDDYLKIKIDNNFYLAVKRDGKWGWINWLTGEEKSKFVYETFKDLPYPNFKQNYYFED